MPPNRAAVIAYCAQRHNAGETIYYQIIRELHDWYPWGNDPESAMERYLAVTDEREQLEVAKARVRAWRAGQK